MCVVWGRGGRLSSGCGLVPGWCVCGAGAAGVVGYVAQETATAVTHSSARAAAAASAGRETVGLFLL